MPARSTTAYRPPSAAAVQLARTLYGTPGDDAGNGRAARPCDPEFRARIRREAAATVAPAPMRAMIHRPVPMRLAAGLAVLLALILVGSWLAGTGMPFAQAATLAPEGELAVEPMPFEQQGQSFPGSAFYYLDASADTAPVPMPGAPLAPQAHWDNAVPAAPGAMGAGPAAQALRQAGSALDRTRALTCLTAAIYYEAASEPDDGQRAVAQVILNRMAHPAFPKTVCGVVYQGSERATGCQFTFTCDGSLARKPMAMFWNRAEAVARAALAGFVYAPVGLATHYHTFAVHPYWDASMNFLGQIGAHRFYRLQGPAGAAAAFRFAYAGGEPLTQGRLTRATGAGATSPDPVAIERTYEASLRAAHGDAQAVSLIAARSNGLVANGLGGIGNAPLAPPPAYANEGLSRGGDAAFRARALPGGDTVRPEYQQSGAWIAQPE